MKILYYSPHPGLNLQSLSGYGTHMREMINAFRNENHEVLPVIMGGNNKSEQSTPPNKGVKKYFKNGIKKSVGSTVWQTGKDYSIWRFDKKAEKKLQEKVDDFKPDLIYERGHYLQLSGIKIASQKSIKHCLEVNSPFIEERAGLSGSESLFTKVAERMEKDQLIQAGLKVFVSKALESYYSQKYKLDEKNTLVTPNAINPLSINVDSSHVYSLKKKLALEDKNVIGFVGSIFKWHGVDILLRAFDKLNSLNTKLLIVGDGEYLNDLKREALALDRHKDIIFTGKVNREDIFSHIQVMDICVMANSNWYGSPVKIFEYGILGKPIIAPDVDPIREVMANSVNGLIVKPNEESVAEAIHYYLENKNQATEIGESFRKKILKNYVWENNAKRVIEKVKLL